MTNKIWQPGLGERHAVGRVGAYREWARTDEVLCSTVTRRGEEFFTAGPQPQPLASLELPLSYSRKRCALSWTGERIEYRWDDDGLTLENRSTLPGLYLKPQKRTLHLRWAFGNAPGLVDDLDTGQRHRCAGKFASNGRNFHLNCQRMPVLLVLSAPLASIEVVSYEHWAITFAVDGGALLWVPLLDAADRPSTPDALKLWRRLAEAPPLSCEESYRVEGDTLHLRQYFSNATLAPLPPLAALLGNAGGLQKLPQAVHLAKTLLGPYSVVDGNAWEGSIELGWSKSYAQPTRTVSGELSPIPKELAYAGDVTWEPGTPMDQYLALRVWAPLAGVAPKPVWDTLLPQLAPPSANAFRASLMTVTEPTLGLPWSKEARLFEHAGDVSYDSDWYNGLTLSGMYAACRCSDERIAVPARKIAAENRAERAALAAYFEIFNDWALGLAWSDPRGEMWNVECSHNGLEGVLAEAGLRELEHDAVGRARMLYIAGKMAVAFMGAFPLADGSRTTGYVFRDDGDPHVGLYDLRETRGVSIDGPRTKSPYSLAGNFPQYCALLLRHGPVERLRQVADVWARDYPQRYENWAKFYTDLEIDEAHESLKQEARVQAAVFYHLAIDVNLRLWVLAEDPDQIERRFQKPLNLAEQLWCRCGARLTGLE